MFTVGWSHRDWNSKAGLLWAARALAARAWVVALVAGSCLALSWAGSPPASAAVVAGSSGSSYATQPGWLGGVNLYREGSGLPPVSDQPAWDAGIQHHLTYLADTPSDYQTGAYASAHTENPQSPYYTSDGAHEAASSNLITGATGESDVELIDGWLDSPFHAVGILRPSLTQVAFVSDPSSGDAGLDVISGLDQSQGSPSAPILFPGPGMTTNLSRFAGEYPDPRETCGWSGDSVGLPLIALLTQDPDPSLTAQLRSPGGSTESTANGELCLVDDHTYRSSDPVYGSNGASILQTDHAVFLIPRAPLAAGAYVATISQAGQPDITWSFGSDPGGIATPPPGSRCRGSPALTGSPPLWTPPRPTSSSPAPPMPWC